MSLSRRNYEQFDSMKTPNVEENDEQREEDIDDSHLMKLDPDRFVESYGSYGKYQILTYCLAQALNCLYSSSMYVMSYVQLNITKSCAYENMTLDISKTCSIEDNRFGHTTEDYCGTANGTEVIITNNHTARTNLLVEFGLVCDHWLFTESGLTIFTVAAIIAVPGMSILADKYGRKPIIVYSALLAFFANLAASFSPNFGVFLLFRAIVGAASDTYLSVGSVATCEYLTEKARPWITVVYNVAWACGMLWTLLVSQMTDDWRWRYFITSCCGAYAFVIWYFLPESPHWLITHNRTEKLKKYIRTSNKINKKTPDFSECQQSSHHEEKHESFRALLKSKKLMWILVANGLIEMVISLTYFAPTFLSVELDENHFSSFLYSSVVEIPAGLAVLPLMMYMGRKTIVIWCLIFQTLALVTYTVLLGNSTYPTIMMLIAKVMSTIAYTVHPIWANEQFPTSARSFCFSLMNIPQSIGIIMSPYFKHLVSEQPWLPFVFLALFSFISATLAFMLHETKNTKLPTDVESLTNPTEAADLAAYNSSSSTLSSTTSRRKSPASKSSKKMKKTSSNENLSTMTKSLGAVTFADN